MDWHTMTPAKQMRDRAIKLVAAAYGAGTPGTLAVFIAMGQESPNPLLIVTAVVLLTVGAVALVLAARALTAYDREHP